MYFTITLLYIINKQNAGADEKLKYNEIEEQVENDEEKEGNFAYNLHIKR